MFNEEIKNATDKFREKTEPLKDKITTGGHLNMVSQLSQNVLDAVRKDQDLRKWVVEKSLEIFTYDETDVKDFVKVCEEIYDFVKKPSHQAAEELLKNQ